jgi:hypothetical protein
MKGSPVRVQASASCNQVDELQPVAQERACEYRRDPKNVTVGHGYMPPLGGDARAR